MPPNLVKLTQQVSHVWGGQPFPRSQLASWREAAMCKPVQVEGKGVKIHRVKSVKVVIKAGIG
jgi:hypothetical protein